MLDVPEIVLILHSNCCENLYFWVLDIYGEHPIGVYTNAQATNFGVKQFVLPIRDGVPRAMVRKGAGRK